ncbi:pilus assembly protein TadG-related protein, partial [Luteipulveratus flavus]
MRRLLRRLRGEEGRISILIAGLFAILAVLVMGGVDVTAVQLARMRLIDASDAAAADAADAIDPATVYSGGVGTSLQLTDESVGRTAGDSLARQERPTHVTSWGLIEGTGAVDGSTAVVRLRGNVR